MPPARSTTWLLMPGFRSLVAAIGLTAEGDGDAACVNPMVDYFVVMPGFRQHLGKRKRDVTRL